MISKKIFAVKGMHCASCASIIENELGALSGVKNVSVNFALESVKIEFDDDKASVDSMNEAIGKFGYSLVGSDKEEKSVLSNREKAKQVKEEELAKQRTKVLFSFPLAIVVFIIMLWDILSEFISAVPKFPVSMDIINPILMIAGAVVIFWIGKPFLKGIIRFFRYGKADMDTLIGIGTMTAYSYSVIITLFPSVKEFLNLPDFAYFDVAIVVIGFVVLGKYLEARSKIKTGAAIEKLIGLQAKSAIVIRNGTEKEVPIAEVMVNDIVVVKPGTKIPVDGVIIAGTASIDESMVTGESMPSDKKEGDLVIGGTVNKFGAFSFRAAKVGSDTMLSEIIRMVEDAEGSKAPIQAMADRISTVFVPVVLIIAIFSLLTWLVAGSYLIGSSSAFSFGIMAFVGVLVIACPCALGLATPTAIIVGIGKGAENGILIKNAESLEKLAEINTVIFDKTGTITKGIPELSEVVSLDDSFSKSDIIRLAAGVEKVSEHPLAKPIIDEAIKMNLIIPEVTGFKALEGVGVRGIVEGKEVMVLKPGSLDKEIEAILPLEAEGKTTVVVKIGGEIAGLIALADEIKENARENIAKLKRRGIRTIMLTGDNESVAKRIASEVGIDEYISGVLPKDKADKVSELKNKGRIVAMVGDGINDAPALAAADVGIAMATGTDIAIESAGITLLKGDIGKVVAAINLGKSVMRTVRQNLFSAFIYNVIGIPIAAGVLYPLFGIFLNPVFAGLAMAGSSVSVVLNSLRLKTKKIN